MRFGTLCSGIEGAAVAWKPLQWTHAFYAEVDPFCCALLEKRYRGVPNLGDITQIDAVPAVDIVVSGTPCQSFSIQGKRRGMDDDRGQLALQFAAIIRSARPRWIVWENVPGVLSSNKGRDFGAFLGTLDELGYGWAYRCLDAQYFGVPQRRNRVFVVGHYRSWQRAAAVLFDAASRETSEAAIAEVQAERLRADENAEDLLLGWTGDETPKFGIEVCPTLRSAQGGEGVGVVNGDIFRRLSMEEWELLQGFPARYTKLEGWSESHRKRALGNAFCVPVLAWIGRRLNLLEKDESWNGR